MTTYYTAHFLNPDSNGKTRHILFGAEQLSYTFDQGVAFDTCQRMADENGERIAIIENRDCESSPFTEGYFHVIRPTENRLRKMPLKETEV